MKENEVAPNNQIKRINFTHLLTTFYYSYIYNSTMKKKDPK